MRAVILGGGSWGTALGNMLASKGLTVTLWLRDAEIALAVNTSRENPRYLPGLPLHERLRASLDPDEAFAGAALCVLAVPCQGARDVLRSLVPRFTPDLPLICASKGLELVSHKTMSGMVAEELPRTPYAILSGPSFAAEVLRGLPCAVALGCADKDLGGRLRHIFSTPRFRVYSSMDVLGVELGGALKNIIAIAAGVSDGLGLGHNARAALLTRGLAEISRLGAAMGAQPVTFMGLSGLGDLALTCAGDLSRNRRMGLGLAAGKNLEQIQAEIGMVAEGVKTTEAALALGRDLGVELPVAATVHTLLRGSLGAGEAARQLMARALKEE